jgi:DNA polymerase beta
MISKIISEFSLLIDKVTAEREKGWSFKVNNYRKVIKILKDEPDEKERVSADYLKILRQGGLKIANPKASKIMLKIEKILEEGSLGLKIDDTVRIVKELCRIPEIGPAKAKKLFDEGIKTIEELKENKGLLNDKQLIGLRHYEDLEKKIPRAESDGWSQILRDIVDEYGIEISHFELAGSYRRSLLISGDIDCYLAVPTTEDKNVMSLIREGLINEGYLKREDIWSGGNHKLMCVVIGENGIARHLDVWIYPEEQYPFAILYATGCGEFNVKMRNYAKSIGYSLSDKALRYNSSKGEKVSEEDIMEKIGKEVIEFEEDIFEFLGIPWVEPENRFASVKF